MGAKEPTPPPRREIQEAGQEFEKSIATIRSLKCPLSKLYFGGKFVGVVKSFDMQTNTPKKTN